MPGLWTVPTLQELLRLQALEHPLKVENCRFP
jgi:hypothetical protein